MGFIDSLRPSRVVRFAEDPEDESKTAFLNGNGKMSTTSAKPDAVMTASRSLYWTLYAFMFTTILLLSIIIFQGHGNSIIGPTEYWSQDVLGKGNAMAHRFTKAYNHSERDTPETRALYSKYFIEDDIGIPVQNPARYGLNPGYPTKKDKSVEAYIPSFIHQFHCLILFREAWWDLRDKYENHIYTRANEPDEPPETQKGKWDHVEHCMDYLRQTIKCNADTTLESPAVHEDGQRSNTDGMDVRRKCYDMDSVWERYMEHRVPFDMVRPYKCEHGSKHGKCLKAPQ